MVNQKPKRQLLKAITGSLMACGMLAIVSAPLAGCRGDRTDKPPRRFFPDMDDQPKWDPQEETEFFADGRTTRNPVANTVAYGRSPHDPSKYDADWAEMRADQRTDLLREDTAFYDGVDASGPEGWVSVMPAMPSAEMLTDGQELFNTYCAVCHGYTGEGDGMVGQRWSYAPANLMDLTKYGDRATKQGSDGWLFHVTREGVWRPDGSNAMPGYAHAVDAREAWAVVSYLRTLQASQNATLENVPAVDRGRLEAIRGTSRPAAPPAETEAPAEPPTEPTLEQGADE